MGFVDGGSLADEIREGPLDQQLAARHALTIAQSVAYAHARGVFHRDIKPANILIDVRGNPIGCDGLGDLETALGPDVVLADSCASQASADR